MNRIGFGYDLHKLEKGRPLVLGGITIPFDKGLAGHSDADALTHAIIDALLGAAALGNIGQHFPDTDPKYSDANSLELLHETIGMIREAGYTIVNIDANIIAEQPKLAPYLDAMCNAIARSIELDADAVSVKAKTNEGVGPEGRREAISAHAAVLLES